MESSCLLVMIIIHQSYAGCPFGNPFYFLEVPNVNNVRTPEGEILPNRVRISWGKMKNFKCVDYFQVEYYQHPEGAAKLSDKINRHRTFVELEIKPCTDYTFKVVASEDWRGMREDFRVYSDVFHFRVDTVPLVLRPPVVREHRAGRGQLEAARDQEEFLVRVSWGLGDLAWAECVREVEFEYHDTLYNESLYTHSVTPTGLKIDFTVPADRVPCHQDFDFLVRVEAITGGVSYSTWTPPSCVIVSTTTSTTTSTPPPPIDRVRRENMELRHKIESLKQDYHPIGRQVYTAMKESFISGFESFINKKKILDEGNIAEIEKMLLEDPF